MPHTPEQWAYDDHIVNPGDGDGMFWVFEAGEDDGPIGSFEIQEDAERCVEAVNACASLADPEADIREWCEQIDSDAKQLGYENIGAVASARRWLAAHPEKEATREAE